MNSAPARAELKSATSDSKRPIPLEKIGPYAAPFRATWPIREAEGVREHPEWLTEAKHP